MCEKMSCGSVRSRCCSLCELWYPDLGVVEGGGDKNHNEQGTGGLCVAGSDMWMGNGNSGWRRKP